MNSNSIPLACQLRRRHPGDTVGLAVDSQATNEVRVRGCAAYDDLECLAFAKTNGDMREQGRADRQAADAGHDRIESQYAGHEPCGQRAEIVRAWGAAAEYGCLDSAHCFLRVRGRACPVVDPRSEESGFVADPEMGSVRSGVQLGHETIEACDHLLVATHQLKQSLLFVLAEADWRDCFWPRAHCLGAGDAAHAVAFRSFSCDASGISWCHY